MVIFTTLMAIYVLCLIYMLRTIQTIIFLKIMSVRFLSINFILLDLGNDGFYEMFLNGEPWRGIRVGSCQSTRRNVVISATFVIKLDT